MWEVGLNHRRHLSKRLGFLGATPEELCSPGLVTRVPVLQAWAAFRFVCQEFWHRGQVSAWHSYLCPTLLQAFATGKLKHVARLRLCLPSHEDPGEVPFFVVLF